MKKIRESVDMRSLKKNRAVTFTSESPQFKQLIEDCKAKQVKVSIERYPCFISVILK